MAEKKVIPKTNNTLIQEWRKNVSKDKTLYAPIYLDNPKDPRINQYTEAGNQYLYKEKAKSAKISPVVVSDPRDPRLKSYNDSLNLYNKGGADKKKLIDLKNRIESSNPGWSITNNSKSNDKDIFTKAVRFKNKTNATNDPISSSLNLNFFEKDIYLSNKNGVIKAVRLNQLDSDFLNKNTVRNAIHLYKKPTQPVVYKKPDQTIKQPAIQAQQAQKIKQDDWGTIQNPISYSINGKIMYSTEDKMSELFSDDYRRLNNMNVSIATADKLIKERYKISKKGITLIPSDETQKVITEKANKKN